MSGYFENCDYFVRLSPNEGMSIVSPGGYTNIYQYFGYVGYYNPGSSCRYYIQAPAKYSIKLDCNIDIAVTVCNYYVFNCYVLSVLCMKFIVKTKPFVCVCLFFLLYNSFRVHIRHVLRKNCTSHSMEAMIF